MRKSCTLGFGLVALLALLFAPSANATILDSFDWTPDGVNMWEKVSPIGVWGNAKTTRHLDTDPSEGNIIGVGPALQNVFGVIGLGITADGLNYSHADGWHLLQRVRMIQGSGIGSGGTPNLTKEGVTIYAWDDNRGGEYRRPGFGIAVDALYYAGAGYPSEWIKLCDMDTKTGFHDYVLQYNPATDNYEFLVDGGLIGTQARSAAYQEMTYKNNGMTMGRRDQGVRTVEYDVSRMAFNVGPIPEPGICVLLLSGLGAVAAYAWRRKKR